MTTSTRSCAASRSSKAAARGPPRTSTVGALAIAGLPVIGPPRVTCALALGPVGRALAASGLATPAALRRALDPPEDGR